MITQLSDIKIKLNLKTFLSYCYVILLLGSTSSILLGKWFLSGNFSFSNSKFFEVIIVAFAFNILPRFIASANNFNFSSCSCHRSATQLFINNTDRCYPCYCYYLAYFVHQYVGQSYCFDVRPCPAADAMSC